MECKVNVDVNISGKAHQTLNTCFSLNKNILSLSNTEIEKTIKKYLSYYHNEFINQFDSFYIELDEETDTDSEDADTTPTAKTTWKEALFTGYINDEVVYGDILLSVVLVIENQLFVLQPI